MGQGEMGQGDVDSPLEPNKQKNVFGIICGALRFKCKNELFQTLSMYGIVIRHTGKLKIMKNENT